MRSASDCREQRGSDLRTLEYHFTGFKRGDEETFHSDHHTEHEKLEHDNRDPKPYSAVYSHTADYLKRGLAKRDDAQLVT